MEEQERTSRAQERGGEGERPAREPPEAAWAVGPETEVVRRVAAGRAAAAGVEGVALVRDGTRFDGFWRWVPSAPRVRMGGWVGCGRNRVGLIKSGSTLYEQMQDTRSCHPQTREVVPECAEIDVGRSGVVHIQGTENTWNGPSDRRKVVGSHEETANILIRCSPFRRSL